MKYFKKDLWEKMQNTLTSQYALEQWQKNDLQYKKYFDKVKQFLPQDFIREFNRASGFHDYIIDEIDIRTVSQESLLNETNIRIRLKNGCESYIIELNNVESIKIGIVDKEYCICGKMSWGYSEFELLDKNKIKLSVLCDIVNEFEFVFNKIEFKSK